MGRSRTVALAFTLAFTLAAVGARAGQALAWLESDASSQQALAAIAVLESAGDQGLDPADYDAARLRRRIERARAAPQERGATEVAITQSLLRYLHDLRAGRVDPRTVGASFDLPGRPARDEEGILLDALRGGRVGEALAQAQPDLPMYAALRRELAHYRALGAHPAWRQRLPALPGRKVVPGDAYTGLALLAQRLRAVGDLQGEAPAGDKYGGALVDAVRSFQGRHGLATDGIIGTATLAQLEATPAARARQIALAMERLRWTPFMQSPRMVVINVPEFVLRAYEVDDGRIAVRLTSRVVVGKAMNTRTPLFGAAMRSIEFSPYWNVPPSIARKEVVPRLRRDPGYFDREGFEFVTGPGEVVRTLSASQLDAVIAGRSRIRQRPGPRNALGDIKFVFPNHDNIYLHHTPATELFERDRRDFSHGCIRVQLPVELAQFVLQGEPGWTVERIREEMGRGESKTLALQRPVPVLIAYSTVIVKQQRVYFFADLYGHDAALQRVLESRHGTSAGGQNHP